MDYFNKIKEFSEQIYNELGPSYKEHIYVNAMCVHLRNEKYLFHTEVIVPINYMGVQLGYERADIVIYEPIKCILEFKAQTQSISKKEIAQLNKYKKNLDIENGILINFGILNNKLEYNEILVNSSKKIVEIE
jgi:GxxExxY protein